MFILILWKDDLDEDEHQTYTLGFMAFVETMFFLEINFFSVFTFLHSLKVFAIFFEFLVFRFTTVF